METTMIIVHALQVNNGDCFMLAFPDCNKPKLLVIDSGYVGTFQKFRDTLYRLIETYDCDVYMLLTHIDRDHIGGFKCLFRNFNSKECERIAGFYYNTLESVQRLVPCVTKEMVQADDEISITTKTGYADAVTLEKFLTEKKIFVQTGFQAGGQINFCDGLRAHVLSPSAGSLAKYQHWCQRESTRKTTAVVADYHKPLAELMTKNFVSDDRPVNASSISLLIEAFGYRFLFLGDALPGDVVAGLKALGYSKDQPIQVDLVKVSHHGSRYNTSPELLQLIRGNRFFISGTGGAGHPDKETIARIIQFQEQPVLCFNYDIAGKFLTAAEVEEYHIQTEFGTEWRLERDI